MPIAAITVDLDTSHHYRAIHGLPDTGRAMEDPAYTVGVARLLDLFEQHGISATLFVIGQDVDRPAHRALLERAHAQGHELGNHTMTHRYDLRGCDLPIIEREVAEAEQVIEALTGEPVRGFRTPGYNIDRTIFDVIADRGYLYDSSVFPCPPYYIAKGLVMTWRALSASPSRSSMTLPGTLRAPITAYRPSVRSLWRADPASTLPWEVPMCLVPGARFPLIGTSLHMVRSRGFAALMPLLRRAYPDLLQLEFHALDFMDAHDPGMDALATRQPDLTIPWAIKRARYAAIFDRIALHYRFDTLARALPS